MDRHRLLPRGIALGLTTGFASGETTDHVGAGRPAAGLPGAPAPRLLRRPLATLDAAWLRLPPLIELRARAGLLREAVIAAAADRPEAAVLDAAAGTGRLVREALHPRTVVACDLVERRSADPVLRWDLLQPPPPVLADQAFGLIVLSGFVEQTPDPGVRLALRHLRSITARGCALVCTHTGRYPGQRLLRLVPRTPRIVPRHRGRFETLLRAAGWEPDGSPRWTPGGVFALQAATAV